MEKRLYILLFIAFGVQSAAQQVASYSQYMFNLQDANAAYTGIRNELELNAGYRRQWIGVTGAPTQLQFTAMIPANRRNALGLNIESESIGARSTFGAKLTYAYHFPLTKKIKLGFALRGGILQYSYHWDKLHYRDASDPIPFSREPPYWNPVFDGSALLYARRWYFGLEAGQLGQGKVLRDVPGEALLQPRYTAIGGKAFRLSEQLDLKPSFLLQYSKNTPLLFELNASLLYKDIYWLGLGKRFGFGYIAIVQFTIANHLRMGYSYDLPVNKPGDYHQATHEFSLAWFLPLGQSGITSPRYF